MCSLYSYDVLLFTFDSKFPSDLTKMSVTMCEIMKCHMLLLNVDKTFKITTTYFVLQLQRNLYN